MQTSKGYIVPVILVLILLALAGALLFTQKDVESPTAETPLVATSTTSHTTPAATTTDDIDTDVDDADDAATSTATSTLDISVTGETTVE